MSPDPSDAESELLARLGTDDPAAVGELFTRYRGYLRRIAEVRFDERLRTRVDESDLVQDALTEAARSLPAYLAARGGPLRRRRVPVVIHEANASAGWANRVGARSAQRVLSAVPDPGLRRVEVVGVPVRDPEVRASEHVCPLLRRDLVRRDPAPEVRRPLDPRIRGEPRP